MINVLGSEHDCYTGYTLDDVYGSLLEACTHSYKGQGEQM